MVRSSKYYELYIEYQEETKRFPEHNLTRPWQKYALLCPDCTSSMIEVHGFLQKIFRLRTVLIKFNFEALERLLDSRYHGQRTPEQSPAAFIFKESTAPEDPSQRTSD